MVALLAFLSRAIALIDAPSASRCNVSSRCLSDSAEDRPDFFPLGPGACLPRQCALDQQVTLELRYRRDGAHGYLASRARQINTTQRQAVNTDTHLVKPLDRRLNIDGVAPQAFQLLSDQAPLLHMEASGASKLRKSRQFLASSPYNGGRAQQKEPDPNGEGKPWP
jgi:hypothetical protein